MPLKTNTVIEATTGTAHFNFTTNDQRIALAMDDPGIAGDVKLLFNAGGGDNWIDTGELLTKLDPFLIFAGPGVYRLDKSASTNAVAVYLSGSFAPIRDEDLT